MGWKLAEVQLAFTIFINLSILAGYLAALVFDRIGNWDFIFYGAAVLTLLAAVGALVLRASPLPKKAISAETVTATVAR